MRVEVNFGGDSAGAVISAEEVAKALDRLMRTAAETGTALDEIKITVGQAAESDAAARRIAQGIEQIGQEARKSRREIEELKLSTAGISNPGSGLGPFGSGFGRVGVLGTALGLGVATSGPLAGGAAALGIGALGLTGGALGAVGVLMASFQGLGKAIEGDRQAFEKLSPPTQQFVQDVRSLIPWLKGLQETARAGLLPGIDKGLHEFLSPQTAGAIQQMVSSISGELGKLAQEAGKGLGGPAFQTFLNDAGTHGVTQLDNLGHAAGHFADALLVLDHAGQPLTDWLTKAIDDGSRFVDEYLKAADVSGALGEKLGGARHELELLGGLVGALADAVFSLASDLTPLGNLILVDLTAALQGLSHWLQTNRQDVVDLTTGALNALVAVLKDLWPVAVDVGKALKSIVDAMGGWKVAFEIVIGGRIALGILDIAKAVYGLRAALLVTNPELAVLVAAVALLTAAALDPAKLKEFAIPGSTGTVEYNPATGGYEHVSPPSGHGGRATKKPLTEAQAAALLGVTPGVLHGMSAPAPSASASVSGAKLQLPTSFKATHDTMGADWAGRAPGPDAVDLMATPGTKVLAPEDGSITRIDGHNPGSAPPLGVGGPWGRSFYFVGVSGTVYYGTHLSDVAPLGAYKKGDPIAVIGNYPGLSADHIHWAIVGSGSAALADAHGPSTQPSTLARGTGSTTPTTPGVIPRGNPNDPFSPNVPPFSGATKADLLPAALRLAMAKASTTPGAGDDRSSINAAIAWLKANIGGFDSEDQINGFLELAALLGQLKALAPKVKKGPARASRASIISAQTLATSTLALLSGDPGIATGTTATPEQTYQAAEQHLREVRAKLGPEIRKLSQEMAHPMSAADEAAMKAQMTRYRGQLATAVKAVTDATPALRAAFQALWQGIADAATASLEQQRAGYKSPARILLDTLTATHDTQALQDALDQANTDLATALKGHQADAQTQLDAIRQYVGTSFLTNAIDAAQSAVLGGSSQQISGASILNTLQGLLAGGNVVDPNEVATAQKSVEDAKYQIQIAGLAKTADAEDAAFNDSIDKQEAAIAAMAANWEQYFNSLKGNINAIGALWNQFFTSIGSNITTAGAWTGPTGANGVPVAAGFSGFDSLGNWIGGNLGTLPGFAAGGSFVTRGPTPIMVGEGGMPEHVQITPLRGGMGTSTGGDTHVHIHGNIPEDWIAVEVRKQVPAINKQLGVMTNRRLRSGRY